MNDSFLNGRQYLMKSWKSLRSQLTDNLSDLEHLNLIANFWSSAPISKFSLNWDDPQNWPDPWNLLSNMDFDESSISLGMKYTLELSQDNRWNYDRCNLKLIKDDQFHIQKIVLIIDNKWLLNYEYKTVIDYEKCKKRFAIQQEYSYNGKMHSIV